MTRGLIIGANLQRICRTITGLAIKTTQSYRNQHNGTAMLGVRNTNTLNLRDITNQNKTGSDETAQDKGFTVSIEGNIGCGKTTLLEYFSDSANVQAIKEPVDQWTNIQGHNALALLYQDPKRWSFTFNVYAQLTRAQMHMKPFTAPIKLLERSLYSTRYCFIENDYRSNTVTGVEHAIVTSWFDFLISTKKINLDLIVYLRADPTTCYERIKKRDRIEESTVPFSLIESLHTLHEEWLIEEKQFKVPAPVLVIDANCEYEEIVKSYESKRKEILCGTV